MVQSSRPHSSLVQYPNLSPDPRSSGKVARLVDVARAAGVSVSTAGRVLRGDKLPVAAAVAQKVRDVAQHLGYVPNMLARNLRGSRPQTVGLVIGDMLDPYYATVAEVVTERAESEHGLLAVVCNMQHDPALELKYCQQLWEHRVGGLILSGGGFDQLRCADELARLVHAMQASGLAVCTLGPRQIEAPVFCVDNHAAGRLAASQLLAAGHRRIAVLNGNATSHTGRLRLEGALAGLREAGVDPWLCDVDYRSAAVNKGLDTVWATRPDVTGLLATSDFMAACAVDWLLARGKSVPRDISVVGICGIVTMVAGLQVTCASVRVADCSRAALDHIARHGAALPVVVAPELPQWQSGDTLAAPR